jgi:hypothetical protein
LCQTPAAVGKSAGADCRITDGSGARLVQRELAGSYTTTVDGQEHVAVSRFPTGDGDVSFTCPVASVFTVRVGQVPEVGSMIAGIGVSIVGPLLLGTAGLVILIVTGILYATRPPRSKACNSGSRLRLPAGAPYQQASRWLFVARVSRGKRHSTRRLGGACAGARVGSVEGREEQPWQVSGARVTIGSTFATCSIDP